MGKTPERLEAERALRALRLEVGARVADDVEARVLAALDAEGRGALAREADWLAEAHRNSEVGTPHGPTSEEYRRGFASAAGWVRRHAEHGAPALSERALDFGVRATHPDQERPLLLPVPQGRAHAELLARQINGDSTPATAEVVSRPTGGWEPAP